jgi:hypothetical protein
MARSKDPKQDANWAIETLRSALTQAGHTVESAEVIYKKALPWGTARRPVFLVQYTRSGGYASVGCVGPFVRVFDDLPQADIETIPTKTVNRRLLELFIGQFFIDRAQTDDSPRCRIIAADLEASFKRMRGEVGLARSIATAGAENLKSTWVTSLPVRDCQLTCTGTPNGLWLEGCFHVIAPVSIHFDISRGGTSTEYTGSVTVEQPYYFQLDARHAIERLRAVPDGWVSFPRHRLANVIGAIYGPGEILNKWGSAHFKD